jgi:hypothetical protein
MALPTNPNIGDYGTINGKRYQYSAGNRWLEAPIAYVMPAATATAIGGVRPGTGPVAVDVNGVLSVDALSTAAAVNADSANAAAAAAASTAAANALAVANSKLATADLGTTVATLTNGKLTASQIPSITTNETFVVATQAAMLALVVEAGDVCVRTDLSKSYILRAAPATTLANWQELLSPASPVQSIAGRVGAVTLTATDVAGIANVGKTGAYADLTGAPRQLKIWTATPDGTAAVGDEWHDAGIITKATMDGSTMIWLQVA